MPYGRSLRLLKETDGDRAIDIEFDGKGDYGMLSDRFQRRQRPTMPELEPRVKIGASPQRDGRAGRQAC